MRRSLINRRAVSHTIGFILVFTISVILMTSTILVFNSLVENKNAESAEKIALEIANRVSDAIVEAVSTMRLMENTNYTKIVELPSMGNMNYYVELSNGTVYVNTTDGKISVKKKVYNVDKLGFPLEGKVYGSAGRLKITANSTRKFLSLDFGTASSFEEGKKDGDIDDYSPVEPGYVRVTNLTKIFHGSGGYWPKPHDAPQITFLYRVPIIIDNTNYSYENETGETVYIESENLSNYPVAVTIPADFPYHLVDKTSDGKPRLVFWEINVTGHIDDEIDSNEIRPYWIESWNDDPPGVSTVWVKLYNVRNNSKELIYMCFGAINNSTKELIDDGKFETIFGSESQPEYQPENFFLYFEDFDIDDYGTTPSWKVATFPSSLSSFLGISENRNYSFYKIYTGAKKPLTFIRLPYPSVLLCGKSDQLSYQDLMKAPGDPDDPTPGNCTQNSTHYILEARVRFHGTNAIRGEIVTNINVTGLQPDKKVKKWIGGFLSYDVHVNLSDGTSKRIDLVAGDNILAVKIGENPINSEITNFPAKSVKLQDSTLKQWYHVGVAGKLGIQCVENQSFCVLNTSTNSWDWVPANKLKEGDRVCIYNSSTHELEWREVIDVHTFSYNGPTYSIVSPYGNFIADGFLVHSCFMFGGTTISTPPSPSYRMDLGYDIAGRESSSTSVPKLALYKNNQSGNAELFGGGYSFQADHSIEKDTWYVMYTSIINSKVNDWRNNSWKKPIKWNYTLLGSWLFEQRLGGKLATYTPTGVDTSLDGENDPTGEPYLSARNLAIACGFVDTLNSNPAPGSPSFDIDWIRVRKSSKVPPRVSVGAVEAYMVGWADTKGIEAYDRPLKSNALYRDLNNATDKKTFCLYLKGGNYTITIHLGDAGGATIAGSTAFNHTIYIYHNNSGSFEKIAGPIKILQSDHTMDRITFVVSIPDDGKYHFFNLTFSAVELDRDGKEIGSQDLNAPSWVVNGIDIEVGDRTVRMGYV